MRRRERYQHRPPGTLASHLFWHHRTVYHGPAAHADLVRTHQRAHARRRSLRRAA